MHPELEMRQIGEEQVVLLDAVGARENPGFVQVLSKAQPNGGQSQLINNSCPSVEFCTSCSVGRARG